MDKNISYYQKISGTYQNNSQSAQIKDIRKSMNNGFEDSVYCKDIHIVEFGNIDYDAKAVINVAYDASTKSNNLYLIPKSGESLKVGSIVEYNGAKYIIYSGSYVNEVYWKYILVKAEHVLKFYNNGTLYEVPCHIVNSINLNSKSDTYMVLPNGTYKVYIPNWGLCDRSNVGMRFLIDNFAYKVSGVDTITHEDIVCLNIVEDTLNNDDNVDLGIADYYKYNIQNETTNVERDNEYNISLSPIVDVITIGRNLTFTAKVFNGKIEEDKAVNFSVQVVGKSDISKILYYSVIDNKLTLSCNDNYKNIGCTIIIVCALQEDDNVCIERKLDIVSLV